MLPLLIAYALAAAPTPCPSDLLVANPRLRVVRAADKEFDNYVVAIDVTNRGSTAQPNFTRQHLALVRDRVVIGTQPIPPLAANVSYAAAFRVQLVHERSRAPFVVEFRYILDSQNAALANCTSANDRLTATL
jgi:hypothetical protein